MVMCRSCGAFVRAFPDDTLQPAKAECPECGGTDFKDNRSGRTIDTTED